MDFRQIFRTSKKDERITELEAQVARLTDQNTKIAEANQETERILADQDVFIAALKADKMRLEQEATERFETITDLRKDVSAGVERIRELEHDAAEHAVASQRYVKDIAELQGECLILASENSDLVDFVRKCVAGSGIRADRPSGTKLMEQARVLLKQYDGVKAQ